MFFSHLRSQSLSRRTVNLFLGCDRQARPAQGSFTEMENLSSSGYPALEVRLRRGTVTTLEKPQGLIHKDALLWVDGGTAYLGGSAVVGPVLTEGPKQLVSMGAYVVIFPDKLYINTRDLTDWGTLENTTVTTGTVAMNLCRSDGTEYADYLVSQLSPQEPEPGELWLDTSGDAPVLRQYGQEGWSEAADVCVKLSAAGIGAGFAAGDGVEISGCEAESLNGQQVLRLAEQDAVVLSGTVAGELTQATAVTLRRTVPDMDFVVECGNRLWGCKYGVVDGRAVNEIYASKLGDFKNWQCYAGLSTDSYAASRGSDGIFTGAAVYLGSPLFFKEHCMERVYPSAAGAHQIVTLECPGIRRGSAASAVVVDGTLLYHGIGGVYAFDGSLPVPVSAALGDGELTDAVAGAWQGRYYLSARDQAGAGHLLVYDTRRRLWHRQDDLQALAFAVGTGELYCLAKDGRLLSMLGSHGTQEGPVSWRARTPLSGLDEPEQGYLVRLSLCLAPEQGGWAEAWLSYDQGQTWVKQGRITGNGRTEGVLLHLRPRRCRQLQLELRGSGHCLLYSLSAVYTKGGDGP